MQNWKSWVLLLVVAAGCTPKAEVPSLREARLNIAPTEGTELSRKVAVVCNLASAESMELAEYYCSRRDIPPENVIQVRATISEVASWNDFRWNIRDRVKNAIKESKHKIEYIVMMRGVPIRVGDDWGPSVDSMIAGMDLEREPLEYASKSSLETWELEAIRNPYFQSQKHFSSEEFGMYLVTRLDGYSNEDVRRMIQRGLKATARKGPFVFDQAVNRRTGGYASLDAELKLTANELRGRAFQVTLDEGPEFLAPGYPVMGYCSWGSNDKHFDLKKYQSIRFASGAICETFVSTSARTFLHESEGQSLIADLIESGVTGVKGYVSEPFTIALCKPSILFDRYTRGFNLAESFYAASPTILWKDVVIGDPLVNPYATQ